MDFNVEARKLQLENLEQFISSSKDKIRNVLNSLDWNAEDVMQDNHFITCSLDPSHKVPQKSIERHMKKCVLRKEGYDLNEEFLSEPNTGISCIHIDDHKKIEILSAAHKSMEYFKSGWNGQDPDPKTANRLTSTFSTDERLALYDYAIANTTGPAVLPEFDIFSTNIKVENNKPLGLEEKLALERDLKRRKIKYKSVHTSHKNHIEVMREVINGQMELYTDWLNASVKTESQKKDSEETYLDLEHARSTAVSRNSNNSGSSKNTSRKRDDRCNEEANDSRSTSRRTSLDRISDKSYGESNTHKRSRSRSRDNHQKRKEDDYHRYRQHYDSKYRRNNSPREMYRNDRRSSRDRRRSRSRERRRNGHRYHRN